MLPSLEDAPRIALPRAAKLRRVPCPYCVVGFAEVVELKKADTVQVDGIKEPRRCVTCGRYFQLRPRVVIEGVRMEN